MAVGGVIITVCPADKRAVELTLTKFTELQVFGSDERGNILAKITSRDERSIKELIKTIEDLHAVSMVNLAYLNHQDTQPFNK